MMRAGRYARLVFGLTDGWLCDSVEAVTAESIRDNLDQIRNIDGLSFPGSILEEINGVRKTLGE